MNDDKINNTKFEHVTIEDIARLSGVAKSTVSRVINNSGSVSEATRKKVMKIVNNFQYVPNTMARDLVLKSTKSIGIFIGDISNQYYIEVLKGAEEAANKLGYFPLICITTSREKEIFYIEEMIRRRTSGIVIVSTSITERKLVEKAAKQMKVVSLQADIEGVSRIDVTDKSGTYDIINYLIILGHKKIAYLDFIPSTYVLENRLSGYLEALQKNNIPTRSEYIKKCFLQEHSVFTRTMELLNMEDRPTAIHCANEQIALDAYMAIREKGLKIPEDISLTGFDNLPISRLMLPQLTTVSQPIRKMGASAIELLVNLINKTDVHSNDNSLVFPTEILLRGSTSYPYSKK